MIKIAVLDDYLDVVFKTADWSVLPANVRPQFFTDHLTDEAALVNRLRDFPVIVGMRERTPFPASLLDKLPNLKLLVTLGMDNKSFDMKRAAELGIPVVGTGGSGSDPIEATWALILAVTRNIPQEDQATRQGHWLTSIGVRLKGKTLGVIGLGKIGSEVARIGTAFGMKIIAWSQNLTAERAAQACAALVTKEQLLAQSDVVTLHLRLSTRSKGTIGAAEFALMKPTAYLVNTARSGLLDERVLIDVLRARRIAGAALDVFDEEPLPADHPLRSLPNTVVTPHIGGVTLDRYRDDYNQAIEDIVAWLAGKPLRVINGDVLAQPNLRRFA
jgi:phosphoglycerate dehydrogenase-like enzyme